MPTGVTKYAQSKCYVVSTRLARSPGLVAITGF